MTVLKASVNTVGTSLPDPVATKRAIGDRHTLTGGTASVDYVVQSVSSTLTFVIAGTTGPASTTGFGLPTTSGRTNGDLHFETLSQREYVLSGGSWVSVAGPTSTQASGVPGVSGRVPGDLAFDTTANKQYILQGAAGSSFSDDFNRADGTTLTGYTNINNAGGGGSIGILNNRLVLTSGANRPSALYKNIGSSTPHAVQADVIFGSNLTGLFNTGVICKSGASAAQTDGYWFSSDGSSTYSLYRNGSSVATYTDPNGAPTSSTKTLAIQATVGGLVTCYLNGALVITYQDGTPLTGAYGGIDINDSTSNDANLAFDNFFAGSSGTLAWVLTQPQKDQVNTANSGTAVTIPDPTSGATLNRITLTGNATVTLPTPGSGKSFTVVLAQDATGSRTVTWATPSGTIKWPGGVTPTQTSTASKADVYAFICDDGTNWTASVAGQNY